MKTMSKLGLACLLAAFMALGAMGRSAAPAVLKAHADILGAPGSGISGTVVFLQFGSDILPTVQVIATVEGLTPGKHGFHIHANGSCADAPGPPVVPFGGAGGHFDPNGFPGDPTATPPIPAVLGNTNPDSNHPFHMGDVQQLNADSHGRAILVHTTSRITLSPGPLSILDANGSAVIVHANPDQGISGAPGSGVSGGPRIACGIVLAD